MNTQLRNDYDTPNKSWLWVSSEWLKMIKVDKNLTQTFRLLEKVVRETKLRAGPFSESGNVTLSYERNNWLLFKRIPHSSIERHCVDVRVYTIRIINLDWVDQSILLYVVITLFHFERRLHRRWCCVFKRKNRNQIESSRHDAIVNIPWRLH